MDLRNLMGALRERISLRSHVARSVLTLVGGTAIGQAITFFALPILSRLFSPAEFSGLAAFVSAVAILSVVACLRFEIAIPLPDEDDDAANLLTIAVLSSTCIAVLAWLLFLLAPASFLKWLSKDLGPLGWISIPCGIWLLSTSLALQYWCSRCGRFKEISKNKILQSGAMAGAQIIFGVLGLGAAGLCAGTIASYLVGTIGLISIAAPTYFKHSSHITVKALRNVAGRYSRFPKYSVFEALANSCATNLPLVIIATAAPGPQAGYLMMAMRVMAAPLTLIGGSAAQVFLTHAPAESRKGSLDTFTLNFLSGLLKTGAGPLLFAGIVAPTFFPHVFGNAWTQAGVIVAWITPWMLLQFLTSPISMLLHVTNQQRTALLLQLFGVVLRLGSVGWAFLFARDFISEIFAVSSMVFYALYFYILMRIAGVRLRQLNKCLVGSSTPVGLWLLSALPISLFGKLVP